MFMLCCSYIHVICIFLVVTIRAHQLKNNALKSAPSTGHPGSREITLISRYTIYSVLIIIVRKWSFTLVEDLFQNEL